MGCCGKENNQPIELRENGNHDADESLPKYGKKRKYNPTFNGPIQNRSCTDIICCIFFLLLIIAMIGVGAIAFLFGNPKLLLYPTDSRGNTCGTGEFEDKKNIFFFDIYKCIPKDIHQLRKIGVCPTTQICVKDCPTKNSIASKATKPDLYCTYSMQKLINNSSVTVEQMASSGECANYTLESKAIVYRCVPNIASKSLTTWLEKNPITINGHTLTLEDVKNGSLAQEFLMNLKTIGLKVIDDVRMTWNWILAGFGIALVASFFYILLMRWIADILVWLTSYAVLTLCGYGIYYTYMEYKQISEVDKSTFNFNILTNLSSYKEQKEIWLVLCIVLSSIAFILLLLLLALRKRIGIAIKLIKEGSKAISGMLSTLFFPIIPCLFQLMLLSWFVIVMAFLATSGKAEYRQVLNNGTILQKICNKSDAIIHFVTGTNKSISCDFSGYYNERTILYLQIFHIFAWFWVMNFIIAFGQCVLAGAFASWFWTWDKRFDVPPFPLLSSFGRTLRYHIGSLAFGSLIIAMIQIIRATLEYIEYKLTEHDQEPGPVIRFLLKCMRCCIWCLEKFIKLLNKNAYIEIAVYGKNFCVSARNAFFLLMRNILRVIVLDKVTDFLLLLGKITITFGIGFAAYQFFKNNKDLNYYQSPICIIVVATWVLASAFFGVYEMAINTIFICFLEDSEKHDGSRDRPYYMSKKLQKILHVNNNSSSDE